MSIVVALRSARPALWALAFVGLVGLNGPFLYYALFRPDVVAAAQQNPVALVFMAEAFVLVGFGAWGIARLGLRRPGWLAFVALSIAGSLAFSVPAFLLWHLRTRDRGGVGPPNG
ncbi:hypothetical protein RQM47_07035 [Rubrivirga sp. S365]|uniref:DUF2834 domain-containing protein n=1 Tax=Rubrivirga litoralis TaxID=3075598 RepID=A0ABU3BN39_9BACT|nr:MULTISPECIES: hypothetical protein [unclassified Rubrivirga]MDT0630720.1 hypothetical protein [Rubrivirga sp. F394]MDT7856390.1 hypothetical protein [Rubrivirga sp. S365]